MRDPGGLFANWLGKKLLPGRVKGLFEGGLFNPIIANGPEIAGDIARIEEKIAAGTTTEEDLRRMERQKGYLKEWEESRK